MSEPLDVETFVNKQLDLINSEREAEKELVENQNVSQLKRSGSCLTSMHVLETETGLAGRWIWVMGRHASDGSDIPRHSFRNGDSVAILPNKALKQAVNGRLPQQQVGVLYILFYSLLPPLLILTPDHTRSLSITRTDLPAWSYLPSQARWHPCRTR